MGRLGLVGREFEGRVGGSERSSEGEISSRGEGQEGREV